MTLVIQGLATSTPAHFVEQADAARIAAGLLPDDPEGHRATAALYRRAGVKTRHSVLLDASTNGEPARQSFFPTAEHVADAGPTTAARMERFAEEAAPLAIAAARRALEAARCAPHEVSHLITVSCTGFGSPGVDLALREALGLPYGTLRTQIGFMGCHGAINALRVAEGFVAVPGSGRILACAVELCSLHHQYRASPEQQVANALFGDGAAAFVAGGETRHEAGGLRLISAAATVVPDTADLMSWRIGDHGFRMSLSARVPQIIEHHLRPWVAAWLARQGRTLEDIADWAIHPGGPRIVQACGQALGLNEAQTAPSWQVLEQYGNMSSPTVLFILERLIQAGRRGPCVLLAFGPGLSIEAALLETIHAGADSV